MTLTIKRRTVGFGVLAALLAIAFVLVSNQLCISAWFRYGLRLDQCPDGTPRQLASAEALYLRRGSAGTVRIGATATYTLKDADAGLQTPIRRFQPFAELRDKAGKALFSVDPRDGWKPEGPGSVTGQLALPADLPDGDYALHATVKSSLGESSVDVPLAIYAPAKVHVLTDRPLYEPGNTVMFRAVVLRARDLAPLDGRPGRFRVFAPNGEELLDERTPAGAWGVAAGSFPLDASADTGQWRVAWESGGASGQASFEVKPFTLPRFRVEASTPKPFYGKGDKPSVKGRVVYSSGAPVQKAHVEVSWSHGCQWPVPTSWDESDESGTPVAAGRLPVKATTDASGQFTLELPQVPNDLIGQCRLNAAVSAIDPAGDRVEGGASVLLSEDAIAATTVTELANGLVDGFNNRVYLRVTTAAGTVLPNTDIVVKRTWEPSDKGVAAKTDEDGVASLQIDPGPAVNVVIPPMPARLPPRQPLVQFEDPQDLFGGELELSLADRRALEAWLKPLEPCARFDEGGGSPVALGVRLDASGAVTGLGHDGSALAACAAAVLERQRLPAAKTDRLWSMTFTFDGSSLPRFDVSVGAYPQSVEGVDEALRTALQDARPCLPEKVGSMEFPRVVTFKVAKGSKDVQLAFAPKPGAGKLEQADCVVKKLTGIRLAQEAPSPVVGYANVQVVPSPRMESYQPQATVMLGYELSVSAKKEGTALGSTKLRFQPGYVPPLRLRASPVLAEAGLPLEIELIRGPQYQGALPEKLVMQTETTSIETPLDPKTRKAKFVVPKDASGWLEVSYGGAQTFAYVKPASQLSVALRPEAPVYAPGQTAKLLLRTKAGDRGTPAAVGLFGVDESLGQLATLPGADELIGLKPRVTSEPYAFGSLDAQALSMGRVQGRNAAEAAVSRVRARPQRAEIDGYVTQAATSQFDPVEELTDRFYPILGELHVQARRWEADAPADEKMQPATMAKLWEQALDAVEKRGESVKDAYGRRMKLSRLPPDLLALTEPRAVVVQGTRLPEDIENWAAWVARERP